MAFDNTYINSFHFICNLQLICKIANELVTNCKRVANELKIAFLMGGAGGGGRAGGAEGREAGGLGEGSGGLDGGVGLVFDRFHVQYS